MERDGKREILYRFLRKTSFSFRYWPILSFLKWDFINKIDMVMVYNSGNRALIVQKDKKVYTLEYNNDDNLRTDDTLIAFCLKELEELSGKNIKSFACNVHFVLALTEEGEIYCWNFKKENLIKDDDWRALMFPSKPRRMDNFNDGNDVCIVDIACSNCHYLALTNDGKVYAWGNNTYGQIGNGIASDVDVSVPSLVDFEEQKISHISCGSHFSMVVTDTGKVYGWGSNEHYQISFTIDIDNNFCSIEKYTAPHEITAVSGKRIIKVACGSKHTLALTDEGKIYVWGDNRFSQLGVSAVELESFFPMNIPESIEDITAYGNLSIVLSSSGIIYVWGDCFGKTIGRPLPTLLSTFQDVFAFSSLRTMLTPLKVITNDFCDIQNISEIVSFDTLGISFNDQLTCDLIFQVEEQCIYVHKTVLKIRNAYFVNNFHRNCTKRTRNLQDLPVYYMSDFSYIAYKAFLEYLYTRKIDLSSENIIEIMKLADEYAETGLKIKCRKIIEETMVISNVALYYNTMIKYNIGELKDLCLEFILSNMTEVLQSKEYHKLDICIKNEIIQLGARANLIRT